MCSVRFDINTNIAISSAKGRYRKVGTSSWKEFDVNLSAPRTPNITKIGVYELQVKINGGEWITDVPPFYISNDCNNDSAGNVRLLFPNGNCCKSAGDSGGSTGGGVTPKTELTIVYVGDVPINPTEQPDKIILGERERPYYNDVVSPITENGCVHTFLGWREKGKAISNDAGASLDLGTKAIIEGVWEKECKGTAPEFTDISVDENGVLSYDSDTISGKVNWSLEGNSALCYKLSAQLAEHPTISCNEDTVGISCSKARVCVHQVDVNKKFCKMVDFSCESGMSDCIDTIEIGSVDVNKTNKTATVEILKKEGFSYNCIIEIATSCANETISYSDKDNVYKVLTFPLQEESQECDILVATGGKTKNKHIVLPSKKAVSGGGSGNGGSTGGDNGYNQDNTFIDNGAGESDYEIVQVVSHLNTNVGDDSKFGIDYIAMSPVIDGVNPDDLRYIVDYYVDGNIIYQEFIPYKPGETKFKFKFDTSERVTEDRGNDETNYNIFIRLYSPSKGESKGISTRVIKKPPYSGGGNGIVRVVNAGEDITLKLEEGKLSTAFAMSVSNIAIDEEYAVSSIKWKKVSGGDCEIENENTKTPTFNNLGLGKYIFKMIVTYNDGSVVYDTVNITVKKQKVKLLSFNYGETTCDTGIKHSEYYDPTEKKLIAELDKSLLKFRIKTTPNITSELKIYLLEVGYQIDKFKLRVNKPSYITLTSSLFNRKQNKKEGKDYLDVLSIPFTANSEGIADFEIGTCFTPIEHYIKYPVQVNLTNAEIKMRLVIEDLEKEVETEGKIVYWK